MIVAIVFGVESWMSETQMKVLVGMGLNCG